MLSRRVDLGQKADLIAVGCHSTLPADMEQGEEEQTGNMTGHLVLELKVIVSGCS